MIFITHDAFHPLILVISAFALALTAAAEEDAIIADFESDGFGGWQAEGEVFGEGPTREIEVLGREGERFVSSHQWRVLPTRIEFTSPSRLRASGTGSIAFLRIQSADMQHMHKNSIMLSNLAKGQSLLKSAIAEHEVHQ